MGVLKSTSYSILETPVIGYQNLVTTGNISAGSFAVGYPATNMANPATHMMWKSTVAAAGSETITLALNSANPVDYVGIAKHNLAGSTIALSRSDPGDSPAALVQLVAPTLIPATDSSPIILRFAPQNVQNLVVQLTSVAATPQIAVVYAGKLLDLGRGVKAEVEHTSLPFGRRSTVVNGMSESGNFLGRIVLSEMRQSRAEFFGFTHAFYVASIDAFLDAAQEFPFFWAWAPGEFPTETGYAWLTNIDAEPRFRVDTAMRNASLTLEMRGIA